TKGKVVRCPFDHQKGEFRLELLEQLITPKTRIIGVCNPHNPLGRLMTLQELELIAQLANKYNLWIMNDEIWSDIVYPEKRFVSFHHLPKELTERVISCYGFSKAFGLAGLRIGAIICPSKTSYDAMVQASNVMTTAGGAATISQIAATTALRDCWYWVDEFTQHLTELRDYAVTRLNLMPGVTCQSPEATYLLFPNIELTGLSADQLVAHLLKFNVAVVPGNEKFFGPGANGHIRICFATSKAILSQGLDRMEQALNQLGKQ
ncbi:MAG: pyridoxal phosphate-dependent aminotransferase, partial [Alphaproteobacteria bacterium]|nr:pyridoxal phosphate-dependent aminotransferase [Alphaproteobacteria bacterium]